MRLELAKGYIGKKWGWSEVRLDNGNKRGGEIWGEVEPG